MLSPTLKSSIIGVAGVASKTLHSSLSVFVELGANLGNVLDYLVHLP